LTLSPTVDSLLGRSFNVLRAGERIGSYVVTAPLKSGGMASLYLARKQGPAGFARHVGVKVIHPHLAADPTFVQMFIEEAKLSARIEHPNVVHVEDLAHDRGTYFLAMEYVQGCTLGRLVGALRKSHRRLTPPMAVAIAVALCDGLHAAHETRDDEGELLGVVHRDVSPQNVLLAFAGHVKLIDFGIAKARGRSLHSVTGTIRGKLRYMPPEQAHGREVDRRSDVFALSVVLWEMLTGRRCFDAKSDLAVLDMVRNPRPAPPSEFAPEVTPALDAAVLAALAASPEDRPPTALAFRASLLAAVPEASTLGAPDLSALLAAVLPDDISEVRRFMLAAAPELAAPPASEGTGAGTITGAFRARDEALEAMTVAGAFDPSIDVDIDAAMDDVGPPLLPPPTAEPESIQVRGLRRVRARVVVPSVAIVALAVGAVVARKVGVAGARVTPPEVTVEQVPSRNAVVDAANYRAPMAQAEQPPTPPATPAPTSVADAEPSSAPSEPLAHTHRGSSAPARDHTAHAAPAAHHERHAHVIRNGAAFRQ
jgi:serine/threonine-protein kinase